MKSLSAPEGYGSVQRIAHFGQDPRRPSKEVFGISMDIFREKRERLYNYLGNHYPAKVDHFKAHHYREQTTMEAVYFQIEDLSSLLEQSGCPINFSRLELYITDGRINREMFVRELERRHLLDQVLAYIQRNTPLPKIIKKHRR